MGGDFSLLLNVNACYLNVQIVNDPRLLSVPEWEFPY